MKKSTTALFVLVLLSFIICVASYSFDLEEEPDLEEETDVEEVESQGFVGMVNKIKKRKF